MGDAAKVITAPVDFVADLVEEIPLIGEPVAQVIQAPVHALVGDFDPLINVATQAGGALATVASGVPTGAPGGETLLPTEGGALNFLQLVQAALKISGDLGFLTGTVDRSVGGRLAQLAGTHGDLLQSIIAGIFPELGQLTKVLTGAATGTLPATGRAAGRQARYGGIRTSTVERMARLGMLPASSPAEILRERLPQEAEEIIGGGAGFEDLAVPGATEVLAEATGEVGRKIAGIPGQLLEGLLAAFFEGGKHLLLTGRELIPPVVGAMSDVGRDFFGGVALQMVEGVKGRLERHGPVGPGQQGELYKDLIGQAATAGIGAHLTASALELLMPLKHLGLPQIAALMADLAGFGLLTGSQLGPLVKAGIGRPAEYEANAIFRSQLPDLGTAKQLVLERIIGLDTYRELLRFAGYSEEWVERYVQEVWEEPSLRELSTVVDDNPVDEDWLRVKVRETGLSDDDVERFMEGLRRRAVKGQRISYISSLQIATKDGLLDESELEGELEALGLSLEARDLIRRRAALEKRRDLAMDWERVYRGIAIEQAMGVDDYRLALQGLGFREDRIQVLVAMVEAELTKRVARDERADLKTAIRDEQRFRVQLAQEAFRRRQIDARDLEAILTGLGILDEQARAMVALEEVRREPIPRVPVPLTPEAQRERENAIIQDAALVAFREGKVDEAALARVLRSLGIPDREVEALVTLELARKDKPKPVVVREDPAVVRARQLKTEAAIQEFRAGRLSEALLRQRLTAAGHPPVVVEGFVERELARLPAPA